MNEEISAKPAVFYDEHWEAYGDFIKFNPGARRRRKMITDLVRKIDHSEIADVGSGSGELIEELISICNPTTNFYAFDFSQVALNEIEKKLSRVKTKLFDLEKDLVNQQFNLVICSEVLEHLDLPNKAAEKLINMTKFGGYILVTVPAGPVRVTQKAIGHTKHPSKQDIFDWFVINGKTELIAYANWGWPAYRLVHWAVNLNAKKTIKHFGSQNYGFVAQKVSLFLYLLTSWLSFPNSRLGVQQIILVRKV